MPAETFEFDKWYGESRAHAQETHMFIVSPNGHIEHSYRLDAEYPDEFGIESEDIFYLGTSEEAINFVDVQIATLKRKLDCAEKLRAKLTSAKKYVDKGGYPDFDNEDSDGDEDDETDDE